MAYFAEFHDAQLGDLTCVESSGRIEIAAMCVFEQITAQEFDVWAYEGEIIVEGVSDWPSEIPSDDDSVCFVDGLPNLVGMAFGGGVLSKDFGQVAFTVELCSGSEFRVAGSSVILRLTHQGELLWRWSGPL